MGTKLDDAIMELKRIADGSNVVSMPCLAEHVVEALLALKGDAHKPEDFTALLARVAALEKAVPAHVNPIRTVVSAGGGGAAYGGGGASLTSGGFVDTTPPTEQSAARAMLIEVADAMLAQGNHNADGARAIRNYADKRGLTMRYAGICMNETVSGKTAEKFTPDLLRRVNEARALVTTPR